VVDAKIEQQVDEIVRAYSTPVAIVEPSVILESAVMAYVNLTATHRVFKKDRVVAWCITSLVDRVVLPCLKSVDVAQAFAGIERVVTGIPDAWLASEGYTSPVWGEGIKGFLIKFVKRDGGEEYRKKVGAFLSGIRAYNEASLVDQ
jgi:hypothetical protein